MNRKSIANETLAILRQGFYSYQNRQIDIALPHQASIDNSCLITIEEGQAIKTQIAAHLKEAAPHKSQITLVNQSTVSAIFDLSAQQQKAAVLNFASAKNPGGGFLNGAMAQEESLAVSSGLYDSLCANETYYTTNRALKSMAYCDLAIFSPEVVFFRDEHFQLIDKPVLADVLTIPAVNYGQVLLKRQNAQEAKTIMRERMALILCLFAAKKCPNIILGAYGCGVFRNEPEDVARWWHELLIEENMASLFERIVFAVLDKSKDGRNFAAFKKYFG